LKPNSYTDDGNLRNRRPYQFKVELPAEDALITEEHLNGKWEILLITGGVSHQQQGKYETPEQALAALQRRLDAGEKL